MRIAFTGSHATGKTSLVQAVANALGPTASVTHEVARDLIRQGVPLNDQVSTDSFVAYATAQIARHRSASGHHILSDRSLFDLLAYVRASSQQRLPPSYLTLLTELVLFESRLFEFYVYVPIEFPLETDDVRPSDLAFQEHVDITIVGLLKELQLPHHTVRGDLQERVASVLALLKPVVGDRP